MTTSELLVSIRNALATDATLATWCTANLAAQPTIFLGIDDVKPPAEDDYPIVAVVGIEQSRGESERELEWSVMLGIGVVNEEIVSSGSMRTRSGWLQAESLREQVENALYRARIASAVSAGDASSECFHPLYVSYSTVTFTVLKTTRRGLPT